MTEIEFLVKLVLEEQLADGLKVKLLSRVIEVAKSTPTHTTSTYIPNSITIPYAGVSYPLAGGGGGSGGGGTYVPGSGGGYSGNAILTTSSGGGAIGSTNSGSSYGGRTFTTASNTGSF